MHMLTEAPMATPQKIVLLWHSTTSYPELTQLRYYGVRDIFDAKSKKMSIS